MSKLPERVSQYLRSEHRLERLAQLQGYHGAWEQFDLIAQTARDFAQSDIGLVTFVGPEHQSFLGSADTDLDGTSTNDAFCAFTLFEAAQAGRSDVLIVQDATKDERFRNNNLVTQAPFVRFYAGAPIIVGDISVGTVCVLDSKNRSDEWLTEHADELAIQLRRLAQLAASLFKLIDSDARRKAEHKVYRREQARHALAAEAADIASWIWDLTTDTIECDPILGRLIGAQSDLFMSGDELFAAFGDEDGYRLADELRSLRDDDEHMELRLSSRDGKLRFLVLGKVLDRDADGNPISVAGALLDVTKLVLGEETERVLLRELNHRVRNTLAILQSLAAQTLNKSTSPEAFFRAFMGRIRALTIVHQKLTDRGWHNLRLGVLIQRLMEPYIQGHTSQVSYDVDEVVITSEAAISLALVVNELATNAVKYGALSDELGRLDICVAPDLSSISEPRINLNWEESHLGDRSSEPPAGFGERLIKRALDNVVGSQVSVVHGDDSYRVKISLPA